jgi:hypothetical protein
VTASMRPTEHSQGLAVKWMVRTGDPDARREAFEMSSVWLFPLTRCPTRAWSPPFGGGSATRGFCA